MNHAPEGESRLARAWAQIYPLGLPAGFQKPRPRFVLRCSDCTEQLGSVFATSEGALLVQRSRKRFLVRRKTGGWLTISETLRQAAGEVITSPANGPAVVEERIERRAVTQAWFLDELTDSAQLRCSRHGWRQLEPVAELVRLLKDPPARGVLPLLSAQRTP